MLPDGKTLNESTTVLYMEKHCIKVVHYCTVHGKHTDKAKYDACLRRREASHAKRIKTLHLKQSIMDDLQLADPFLKDKHRI